MWEAVKCEVVLLSASMLVRAKDPAILRHVWKQEAEGGGDGIVSRADHGFKAAIDCRRRNK